MPFSYKFESKKEYALISLEGALLSANDGKEMLQAVDKDLKGQQSFIVDMGKLNHLSSEGFNVLLNILTRTRNVGGETVLCNLSTHIQSLFIMTKLTHIFTITENKKEAIEKIKKNA